MNKIQFSGLNKSFCCYCWLKVDEAMWNAYYRKCVTWQLGKIASFWWNLSLIGKMNSACFTSWKLSDDFLGSNEEFMKPTRSLWRRKYDFWVISGWELQKASPNDDSKVMMKNKPFSSLVRLRIWVVYYCTTALGIMHHTTRVMQTQWQKDIASYSLQLEGVFYGSTVANKNSLVEIRWKLGYHGI